MPGETPQVRLDVGTLSFVAGFVDTCVFVGLFGLFTAHITGNIALIGAAIVHGSGGELAKLLALPTFVIAVMLTALAAMALRHAERVRLPLLLATEGALLALSALTVAASAPFASPDIPAAIIAGMLSVAAMGVQNALMRMELTSHPSTTVMTVNVTQLVIDAVASFAPGALTGGEDPTRAALARERLRRLWPPACSFLLGAIFGAVGYALAGLEALLLPALLCLTLAAIVRRGKTRPAGSTPSAERRLGTGSG
jgi:uncharacterized membrane protein YoaK (UPF0700 family)